jgi:hypothetical protein
MSVYNGTWGGKGQKKVGESQFHMNDETKDWHGKNHFVQ